MNIATHELVGLHARVTHAPNPSITGISGTVIDETMSMLKIMTERGARLIPKAKSTLEMSPVDGRSVSIEGSRLVGRPHTRLEVRS